jgi:ferrochelatase
LSSLYNLKKYNIKDVEGFLYNLFADPDIIRLPSYISYLQKPIAYFIAKRRAPKSKEAYASIGGGSPIVAYTKAQADLIQTQLAQRGLDVKAYFAMRLIQENKF